MTDDHDGGLHDPLVFDAEPLVAYADDEPGSDVVEKHLTKVEKDKLSGYVSYVNLTEVKYILSRSNDRETARQYIEGLIKLGLEPYAVDDVWNQAAEVILNVNPSLGDAFAVATAKELGGTLIIGGDSDFNYVEGVWTTRFRDHGV